MVSCDMTEFDPPLIERIKKKVDGHNGIDSAHLTVGATHTHTSSYFSGDFFKDFKIFLGEDKVPAFDKPDDLLEGEEATQFWLDRISSIIFDAWDSRKPGGIAVMQDYAAIAFNRRPVFKHEDGTEESIMYGACSKDSFVRFEGSSDHSVQTLFTFDENNELTGAIVDVPCPSQIMELHYFISADYWHYARTQIRKKLDKNIFVLPICGAAGDQNPIDLVKFSKTNEKELALWNAQAGEVWCNYDPGEQCNASGERIADAVARAYRRARNRIRHDGVLDYRTVKCSFPIRKVTKADYEEADKLIKDYLKKFPGTKRMDYTDLVKMFEPIGVVSRYKQQNENDKYDFETSIFRIGDAAFASNPFELFVDYSFRIQARSKARNIFIMQLTNGSGGYLPTVEAVNGGSYSSKPASTTVGPDGGDKLVEITIKNIDELFEG